MRKEVQIRTDSLQCGEAVPLINKAGKIGALIYPIPYLDPTIERERLSPFNSDELNHLDNSSNTVAENNSTSAQLSPLPSASTQLSPLPRTHQAVLSAAMEKIKQGMASSFTDFTGPRIIMAHAFIAGSEPSSSETNLEAGGVEAAAMSTFEATTDINYVALGHVHRPQTMYSPAGIPIRYAGSPIAFSFSEAGQEKTVTILEFSKTSNNPKITKVSVPKWREVSTIYGKFAEIISQDFAQYREDFVRVYLQDELRPDNAVARLRQIFPYLLQVHHQPAVKETQLQDIPTETQNISPLELITKFFTETGNRELSKAEQEVVTDIWTKLNNDNSEEK